MESQRIVGALMGWKRTEGQSGVVITLQVARNRAAAMDQKWDHVSVALNDRQLRSFARDLQRAAQRRGIILWPKRKTFGLLRTSAHMMFGKWWSRAGSNR